MTLATSNLSDLVRFLVARVDEDDDELRRLQRTEARAAKSDTDGLRSLARQRAECNAKRNIIGHAQQLCALRDLPAEKAVRDAAAQMLHALAEPYRGHYGYRPEWGSQR